MIYGIFFIFAGYLSGSILFAYLIPKYFYHIDICRLSDDQNPGAFNAFTHTGIRTGTLILLLELAKGFFPVHIALHVLSPTDPLFALVLAAPVIGHAFPLFHPRMGGKAIAVSFGCLLGLYPDLRPVLTLAAFYLIFSLLLVIDPHLFRSMITYLCLCLNVLRTVPLAPIRYGTILISIVVILRHAVRYGKRTITDPSAETEPLMVLFSFSMPLRSFSDITPSSPAAYPLDSHFR